MGKLKSRKFWMALVSGLLVVFNKGLDFNIPDNTIMAFAGIAISYIFGQGWVDGQEKKAEAAKIEAIKTVQSGAQFLSSDDLKQAGRILLHPLLVLFMLAMLGLCCLSAAHTGHSCKPANPYHQMLEAERTRDNACIRVQYLGDRAGYKNAQSASIIALKRTKNGK